MNSELKERVLRELSREEVLHMREIVNRINASVSTLKHVLNEMVEEGLLERFSHGGYTFYRITAEGKSYLIRERSGAQEEAASDSGPSDAGV
ncbi:MAG: helix-turn-helix domain-containing protein [Candidatus Korarchaeum sp.]